MKRWNVFFFAPFLILLAACSSEEESPYEWQCFERSSFGSCECYEVRTGSEADTGQGVAEEVDDCSGFELCYTYYDAQREQGRCDCGDSDFTLRVSENNRRDTIKADSCPAD